MSTMMKARKAQAKSADSGLRKKLEQGLRLQAQNRHEEAVSRFRKVFAADRDNMEALLGLARSLIATGREQEAVSLLDNTASATPDKEDDLGDIARVCMAIEHFTQAEELYRRILDLNPDAPVALTNLANLVERRGEVQLAVDLLSKVIERNPHAADAYSSLGRVLAGAGMFEDSEACYRQAIALNPDAPTPYTNLAALLETLDRHEEALALVQQALALNPECDGTRWNLARLLLMAGHIEAGWDMYGFGFACRQRTPYRPFPGLIWEGEDLSNKTMMVWREQGLGDDILFSTCYSDLIGRAGHVIIETDARLVSLYQRTWPQATVRAETWTSTGLENYGAVDFDYTAPAGLVAAQLRRSLSAFPENPHTLVPDPERVEKCRAWLETLGPGPKIGLSWTSGKVNKTRSINYTNLSEWKALFEIEGAKVVSLQYTNIDAEAEALEREFGLTLHRMPEIDLFSDLEAAAALTSCMDVVVGPPSFPVVLGAALGRPCFHYGPPHIWTRLGTNRMPWFPSMRCYSIGHKTDKKQLAANIVGDVASFLSAK